MGNGEGFKYRNRGVFVRSVTKETNTHLPSHIQHSTEWSTESTLKTDSPGDDPVIIVDRILHQRTMIVDGKERMKAEQNRDASKKKKVDEPLVKYLEALENYRSHFFSHLFHP